MSDLGNICLAMSAEKLQMWEVVKCVLLWQMDVDMTTLFTSNVDCSVFVVSVDEKIVIYKHEAQQVINHIESNINDRVSCLSISMDGTVLATAVRDSFKVFAIENNKKRLKCVHTANLSRSIAQICMTPMSKFIAVLLISGDVLVFETLTGIFIHGLISGQKNAPGVWIGPEKLEDEFKKEGLIHLPLSGQNKLYADLSNQ